jgi:hypothetical protein
VHVETRSASFFIEPQNQGLRFVSGLAPKPLGWFSSVFSDLTSKPVACVFWFRLQNWQLRFGDFGLKTKQTLIYRFRHKINGGRTVRDTRQDLATCFAWKQVWLGFPSLTLRLVEARRWVVYVAPSWRLRQVQLEDERVDATGYVGPCYPCFTIFLVLCHRGTIVF